MLARSAPRRRSTSSRRSPPPVWSCVLLRRLLYGGLVVSQCLGPEPLEVGAQGADPVGVQPVDAAVSRLLVDHEPRLLQHLQVLRDGRPTDRQLAGEVAN